jgi:hypothetical protein
MPRASKAVARTGPGVQQGAGGVGVAAGVRGWGGSPASPAVKVPPQLARQPPRPGTRKNSPARPLGAPPPKPKSASHKTTAWCQQWPEYEDAPSSPPEGPRAQIGESQRTTRHPATQEERALVGQKASSNVTERPAAGMLPAVAFRAKRLSMTAALARPTELFALITAMLVLLPRGLAGNGTPLTNVRCFSDVSI